ncbi:hypothetical protein BJY52DRAFT_932004 [Lactarius psammicola]|nr:hypothetical protein BJY52DRAFT_932004 [Lactarius psammicola]
MPASIPIQQQPTEACLCSSHLTAGELKAGWTRPSVHPTDQYSKPWMSRQQPAAKPLLQSIRIKARKGAVKVQAGSTLEFLKYSDALFDILFVGGLLQPGSSYLDADDPTSPFSLFQINAPAETEDIKKFVEVGATTRFLIIVPCHSPLCRHRRRPQQSNQFPHARLIVGASRSDPYHGHGPTARPCARFILCPN